MARPPSFTSEPRCCYRRSSALRGQRFGRTIGSVAVAWGLVGLSGLVYSAIVLRRMRQTAYRPVFEDWMFHCLLPFGAYAILTVSAYSARSHAGGALFAVGAAALLLLFIGIHNAWDSVTYHVFYVRHRQRDAAPPR